MLLLNMKSRIEVIIIQHSTASFISPYEVGSKFEIKICKLSRTPTQTFHVNLNELLVPLKAEMVPRIFFESP